MAHDMFDLGNTWNLKEQAQRLDIQVFFRGISYAQDTIMVLAKLQEAGFFIHQYVMYNGENWDSRRSCSGEADLAIVTYYMPEQTDYVNRIYDTLFDFTDNACINEDHWLNDYDQYCKIQVRHRVDGGKWSEWQDEVKREAA